MDAGFDVADEFGGEPAADDKPFDDEPFDAGVEADETEEPKQYIQQLAGKIGQSLRKYEKEIGDPDFELEKFVVNSVLSATNTGEMDAEDQKDIITKVKTSGLGDGGGDDVDVNIDTDGGEDVDVNVDEPAPEEFGGEEEIEVEEGLAETGGDLNNSDEISNFVNTIQSMVSKGVSTGIGEVLGIHNNEEDMRDDLDLGLDDETVVEPQTKPKVAPPKRIKTSPFTPPSKKPKADPKPKFG